MICCKIVADYQQVCSHFNELFEELNKYGDVLWDSRYFFFANTVDRKISEKAVQKILKKHQITSFFLEKYGRDYQPTETDQINWWVEDKLIKIGYEEAEDEHQDDLKHLSQQLDELNDMIQTIKQSQSQSDETK